VRKHGEEECIREKVFGFVSEPFLVMRHALIKTLFTTKEIHRAQE
jgi:hypothetical protein